MGHDIMVAFLKLLEIEIKDYFRSPVTAFWTFLYPFLIFAFLVWIFGNTEVPVAGLGTISYIPYLISGMLTINIISTSLFGFSLPVIEARGAGALKMHSIFPVSKFYYVSAVVVSRILISVLFNLLFVLASAWWFSVELQLGLSSLLYLSVFIFLVSASFISAGFMFVAYCEKPATGTALANILFFPLMFLSNSFMPMDRFPAILVLISEYSPLGSSSAVFRHIILGDTNANISLSIMLLTGLMIFSLAISLKTFKWH